MKTLLTKFRLSNALDDKPGAPVPDSLAQKVKNSSELREFAQSAAALEGALRNSTNVPVVDETLHLSIMRAVRATATQPPPRRVSMGIGLAAALGALAALAMFPALRAPWAGGRAKSPDAQQIAVAQVVREIDGALSQPVPARMVAPLSNEWASVDHDIRNTTRFILASLP
jgi:hypothetical protein